MQSKPYIKGKWLEVEIQDDLAGKTLEDILRGDLAISGRMIQRLTRSKGLFLNRKVPFLGRVLKTGDLLRVMIADKEEKEPALQPEPIPIDVVYEDDEILIVNKQPGIIVHPIKAGQGGTLANGILHYWLRKGTHAKVRPVHRLDKDTSGLLLVAKNSYIHQLLDRDLKERRIYREYTALVHGSLASSKGSFTAPIGQDSSNPVKRMVRKDGEEAITHYELIETFQEASVVRVWLETGRTHQIRVHFAHAGHPVIGDSMYGGAHSHMHRQALHAVRLVFTHPLTRQEMSFTQELPDDIQTICTKMKQG